VTAPKPRVDAVIPLAVLETVRWLDAPRPDGLQEYHSELASKRLGMSATVAAQIDRFRDLARSGESVDGSEVEQLLRLAGRRVDAALVFDEAGRRAAGHAIARLSAPARWAWRVAGPARRTFGMRVARAMLSRVFGLAVEPDGTGLVLTAGAAIAARAVADGAACGLYGAAAAALLRRCIGFEGAVAHESCVGHGAPACVWRTLTRPEE